MTSLPMWLARISVIAVVFLYQTYPCYVFPKLTMPCKDLCGYVVCFCLVPAWSPILTCWNFQGILWDVSNHENNLGGIIWDGPSCLWGFSWGYSTLTMEWLWWWSLFVHKLSHWHWFQCLMVSSIVKICFLCLYLSNFEHVGIRTSVS